jgi:Transposase DDE domain group 1
VKKSVRSELRKRKRQIERRLEDAAPSKDTGRPVISARRPHIEIAERTRAMPHGGIGAAHQVVVQSGLIEGIDAGIELLKIHRPYHESDHVLNIAYNALCGGRTLDDIEFRRNDEAYLDSLGATAIPDPTTAGDFCRRFKGVQVELLMDIINEARLKIWKRQGPEFVQKTARIDADGSLVPTTGESKEGMGLSYNGVWGYHPLLVSLANTREPLFLVNRSGNRPSYEGAAGYLDKAIVLCQSAGFLDILLRGDTDFSQTEHLDRWTQAGIRFVFGYDVRKNLKTQADDLPDADYEELQRRAKRAFVKEDKRRARPPRIKEGIVHAKGYKNIRLRSEDVSEFDYRPIACSRTYRMVVLRKNLTVERGETALFDDIRYFFYITNDRDLTAAQVVFEANDRCNQENLIEQLKNGVRALHAPVNSLNSNWAYMVMASLAWTIKAWMALSLPVTPRWRAKHEAERDTWLHMEFRTFLEAVINMPAQVVQTGRRLVLRLLGWKPQQPVFFRLLDAL